jgi:G3E family GTPase
VREIIDTVAPELIVVETTGVAEPDAVILDIQENLTTVRLDGVITVADADALVRFPQLGQTTRMQIEAADLILLNKTDLVSTAPLEATQATLSRLNPVALIVPTQRCQVDPDLLFGLMRERHVKPLPHMHQPEFAAISYTTTALLDSEKFATFVEGLSPTVYRAKGFVRFPQATYLFNFVAGRWELEPYAADGTDLVFIGKQLTQHRTVLLNQLQSCTL